MTVTSDIPHRTSDIGLRPGRWLLGRGWWCLPTLLSIAIALPWVFGERWYADTPYYQAIATQMAREGGSAWWSLMQGDLHYFNKPPLGFWVHAALVAVFGNTDWATHGPEAAYYVLTCLLTAWLGRRLHGPVVGVLAGCAMALTDDWVWRISNYKLDFPHTLLLLAACACWVKAFVPAKAPQQEGEEATRLGCRREGLWCVLAGLCIGGALMTKPLIGVGLPLFGAAWLWLAGLWRAERAKGLAVSALVGAAVALPWHASMVWMYDATFTRTYVVEQAVMRATGERFESKPWWWYFGHGVAGDPDAAPPWTMWPIYALALAGLAVAAVRWRRSATRPGDALAVLWTVAWMAALSSFAGKHNYYILVVHPGTAWLAGIAIAAGLGALARLRGRRAVEAAMRGAALAGVCACVVLLARVPHSVRRANQMLPVRERDEFMAFLSGQKGRAVYNCGMPYRMAALAYIEAGVWPRSVVEREPMPPGLVPTGALMVYRADILGREEFRAYLDPKDRLVFRSSDGPYAYLVVGRR